MADAVVIQMLKQKRAEISGVIAAYLAKIAQAKHDLAHINASIRLFDGGEQERAQYIVSHGFFKKGEIADICVRHLKADGELDTRQLAERVMCERKLDVSDTPLRNSVLRCAEGNSQLVHLTLSRSSNFILRLKGMKTGPRRGWCMTIDDLQILRLGRGQGKRRPMSVVGLVSIRKAARGLGRRHSRHGMRGPTNR